jgi:hypothetical protein
LEQDDLLTVVHARMAVLTVPPTDLRSEVPTAISRIVMRLLRKAPEDRYQTAPGLRVDLEAMYTILACDGAIPDDLPLGSGDVAAIGAEIVSMPDARFGAWFVGVLVLTLLGRFDDALAACGRAFEQYGRPSNRAFYADVWLCRRIASSATARAGQGERHSGPLRSAARTLSAARRRTRRASGDTTPTPRRVRGGYARKVLRQGSCTYGRPCADATAGCVTLPR